MLNGNKLLILVLFFVCAAGFAEELSIEESAVLNRFFLVLVRDSEAGYVLLNKKPVSIVGFYRKDPFLVGSELHKQSVALKEGALLWNKLEIDNQDIVIRVSGKEDPLITNWIHVLTINRSLFREVVNKSLSLFQYVLGPRVTADTLLEALCSGQTYHSLLKGDKVLIGTILGFGERNALYVSRIENLDETSETPPFLNAKRVKREYENEFLPYEASFGFESVKEEVEVLVEEVTMPSGNLVEQSPQFVFGFLSEESKGIVEELEATQIAIQGSLKSPGFFNETLKRLTGLEYVEAYPKGFLFQLEREKINLAVAKGLWEAFQEYDRDCLIALIEGVEAPEKAVRVIDHKAFSPSYRSELVVAKKHLNLTNQLFSSLKNEATVKCLIPGMLFYRVIQEGKGSGSTGPFVQLTYSVFTPLGECLAHQSQRPINLKNTIPGFAIGVKGMKNGETREIYIHPSLGYGFDGSCRALKVVVTMHEGDQTDFSIAAQPLDLSFVLDEKKISERTENYKAALAKKGSEIAIHLRKCPEIDLNLICGLMRKFYSGEKVFEATNEVEQKLINQVHWNIYFGVKF